MQKELISFSFVAPPEHGWIKVSPLFKEEHISKEERIKLVDILLHYPLVLEPYLAQVHIHFKTFFGSKDRVCRKL